jgi:chromate transporter
VSQLKKSKLRLLAEIYFTFLKLGSVSFGGGYAMISLIEREIVNEKKWVEKEKIIDIFAVSESLPGAIALNSSAFVGFSIAGIPGAIAALLGNLTSPVIIVLTLMIIFANIKDYPVVQSAFKGIFPTIVGLILYAAYKIGKTAVTDYSTAIIVIASFCAAVFLNVAPIPLIISGAVAGILLVSIRNVCKKIQDRSSD